MDILEMTEETPLEPIPHDTSEFHMDEEIGEGYKEFPLVKWKRVNIGEGVAPKPRHGHRAVVVKDLIVVFGGGNEGIMEGIHAYNTTTNQWLMPSTRGELPIPTAAFGALSIGTRILTFGGMIEFGKYSSDLFELQATRWEWRRLRPRTLDSEPPCARLGHTFVASKEQKIYLFGGLSNESPDQKRNIPRYLNDLYVIDASVAPNALMWEKPATVGEPPSPRESHTAVIYENDTRKIMAVYGGMNGSRLGDLYFLDLVSLSWSKFETPETGYVPLPRSLHTSVVIDDKMYIYGGWVPLSAQANEEDQLAEREWKCTNSVATFDFTEMKWQQLQLCSYEEDKMPRARAGHAAVAIGSRMFIWSGRDGYRKAWCNQVCCRDLWILDTMKPEQPGRVQLIRASFNSLEISWSNVSNTDAYLLQITPMELKTEMESKQDNEASQSQPAPAQAQVSTQRQQSGGQNQVMKVIRSSQSVMRYVKQPAATNMGGQTIKQPTKAIIIGKDVPQKVLYFPEGMDEKSAQPTSMISTQGTTYTAPVSTQQPVDESGLPQNLFDESGVDDSLPPSPPKSSNSGKEAVDELSLDRDQTVPCDPTPSKAVENASDQNDDNIAEEVSNESGALSSATEQGNAEEPPVENATTSTVEGAGSEVHAEGNESLLGEQDQKPQEEEEEESIEDGKQDSEETFNWFDVGIVRGNTCNVSHFFSHQWTIADNLDEYNDQGVTILASSNIIPINQRTVLESGVSYRFRVAAVNSLGKGEWSEVSTFKTCLPGFPSAPSSIRITKGTEGAQLTWEPPQNAQGRISEYSVYLAVRNTSGGAENQLAFMRVYVGAEAECIVQSSSLQTAYVDQSNKPAIIFRIAARNEKGYGPATQVRWLQEQKPVSSITPRYSMPVMHNPNVSAAYHFQPQVKRTRLE